ncbi:MAG: YciI family protein [Puia sp.]
MKNFIIIFREPDGRTTEHSETEIKEHSHRWEIWLNKWKKEGKLKSGSGLTLNGTMIRGADRKMTNGIHKVGTEIVGGFLLLEASNLMEATAIAASCPIFEFDGYAEVREMRN